MAEFNTRIQQKGDTQQNFETQNPILLKNELTIVYMTDGSIRYKVGDGEKTFNQLEYTDKYLENDIKDLQDSVNNIDVSQFVKAVDGQGIEATIPPTFDGHTVNEFLLKTDVKNDLNSDDINLPLSASQGKILNEKIIQNQENMGIISEQLNQKLNQKLNKTGGDMSGKLTVVGDSQLNSGMVRNIFITNDTPSNSLGKDGDICFVILG